MASENVVILNDTSFESEVLSAQVPVVVDFWAEWCGPCRMVTPVIDKLAEEFAGKVKFTKLNVDDNRNTAVKYGIRSIPTIMIFKNGQISDQIVGALPEDKLRKRVNAAL